MEYIREKDLYEIKELGSSSAKLGLRTDQLGVSANFAAGYQLSSDRKHLLFAVSESDAHELSFIKDKLLSRVPSQKDLVSMRLFGLDYAPPALKTREEVEAYMEQIRARQQELEIEVTSISAPTIMALEEVNPASVNLIGLNEGYLSDKDEVEVLGSASWDDESLVLKIRGSASFVLTPVAFTQFVEFAKEKREYHVPEEQANKAFWDKIDSLGNR